MVLVVGLYNRLSVICFAAEPLDLCRKKSDLYVFSFLCYSSKPSWNDICAFKLFPFKCQTFLQLFELDDEYIQREIRKPPKQTTC